MAKPELDRIMRLVDEYTQRLESAGISCNGRGFPLLPAESYAQEVPEEMVPFRHRGMIQCEPNRAALCFYEADQRLYPRLSKLDQDLPVYRSYGAVVGMDVTVTSDMDEEWAQEIMLLNSLFTGVLAVSGVPVIANLRCAGPRTVPLLDCIPQGILCASGVLGCAGTRQTDYSYMEKMLAVNPSMVLLYGKSDPVMESQLTTMGFPWRRYPDVHARYGQSRQPHGECGRKHRGKDRQNPRAPAHPA